MSIDDVTDTVGELNWSQIIKNGFSSVLDGAVEKELIKANNKTEQIKPVANQQTFTPEQAVKGVFDQNMIVFGSPVNKGVLAVTGLALTLLAVYKVAS